MAPRLPLQALLALTVGLASGKAEAAPLLPTASSLRTNSNSDLGSEAAASAATKAPLCHASTETAVRLSSTSDRSQRLENDGPTLKLCIASDDHIIANGQVQPTGHQLLVSDTDAERLWAYSLNKSRDVLSEDQTSTGDQAAHFFRATDEVHIQILQAGGPYIALEVQIVETKPQPRTLGSHLMSECSQSPCSDRELEMHMLQAIQNAYLQALETGRSEPVPSPSPSPTIAPTPPPPSTQSSPPPPSYFADYQDRPRNHKLAFAGWPTLALGAAGAGVGLGLVVRGLQTRIPGFTVSPDPDEYDPNAKDYQTPGVVTLLAGSAALVTGAALLIADKVRWKRRSKATSPPTQPRVTFTGTGLEAQF